MMKIILGSASPRRQQLLKEWGYEFEALKPDIDEKKFRSDDLDQLPLIVSRAKSEKLKEQIKEPAILVTCDTIVVYDKQLREKPKDAEEAKNFLRSYSNKPAEVICGVVVANTKTSEQFEGIEKTKVYFREIPENVIEEMVNHGAVLDAAGGFMAQDPALRKYIAFIDGEEEVVWGLPKFLTKKLIDQAQNG